MVCVEWFKYACSTTAIRPQSCITPLGARIGGVRVALCARSDFPKDWMTAPALSVATVPVLQQCPRSGGELDGGVTRLEEQRQHQ